jgi:hypothetical protein
MVGAVIHRYTLHQIRVNAFEAAQIVAVLIWLRTTPMVGVDAAPGAEIVLGGHGIEPINREQFLAFENTQAIQWHSAHDRTLATAHGARAATSVDDAFGEVEFQDYASAMATGPVLWPDARIADLVNRRQSHLVA